MSTNKSNSLTDRLTAGRQTLDERRRQVEKLQREIEQSDHRIEHMEARTQYRRKAKDRARTHRLIQYGAAFESYHKELAVLLDTEIFTLVEKILDVPGVTDLIREAVERHGREET